MITSEQVAIAEWFVDETGVIDIVAAATQTQRTTNQGRRANLPALRLWLIGTLLALQSRRSGTVATAHATLREMPLVDQQRLGIVSDPGRGSFTEEITLRSFYWWTEKITKLFAHGPGWNLDHLTDAEIAARNDALYAIEAAMCRPFVFLQNGDTYALDATALWAWGVARGLTNSRLDAGIYFTEEDEQRVEAEFVALAAGNGTRTGRGGRAIYDPDARNGHGTKKDGGKGWMFGSHLHTMIAVPDHTPDGKVPRLVLAYEVTPANKHIVDVSLRLIDRIRATGPFRNLMADRLYSDAKVENWSDELAIRKIDSHIDFKVAKTSDTFYEYAQVRWAAGWPHCPATPDELGVINRPQPQDKPSEDDWDIFHAAIQARQAYALQRLDKPGVSGKARWSCPAGSTVGCSLRAGSVATAVQHGLTIIDKPPRPDTDGKLPPICCQGSVTITPDDKIRKNMQDLYWGSPQWARIFSRRTYIEGAFGEFKNPDLTNLHRGLARFGGRPLMAIFLGLVIAAFNIRTARAWQANHPDLHRDHPLFTATAPQRFVIHVDDDEARRYLQQTEPDAASAVLHPDPAGPTHQADLDKWSAINHRLRRDYPKKTHT